MIKPILKLNAFNKNNLNLSIKKEKNNNDNSL